MKTTFDIHKQHLTTDYADLALLPKRRTTYDDSMLALTQEYSQVEVGTLQVYGGVTFRFDGEKWVEANEGLNGQ